MEETRKYFDYELAYEGYMRAKELLENGGIQALEEEFEEVGDRANGYTTFYGADYNTWVYVSNINFDTDLQEDNFIEDLDYIKLYLEDAVNYKEIQAEKMVM